MIKIASHRTEPGGEINEDLVGWTESAAWVLDGATGLGEKHLPGKSDAEWFVKAFDQELRSQLDTKGLGTSLVEIVKGATIQTAAQFKRSASTMPNHPYEAPSSGFAIVKCSPNGDAEFLTLGDCKILYQCGNDQPVSFGTSKLEELDEISKRELQAYQVANPGATFDECLQSIRGTLRKNRSLMNTKNGYWVIGLSEEAVQHACQKKVKADSLKPLKFAAVTDGITRLYDTFRLFTSDELLDHCLGNGVDGLFSALRATEAEDRDCRKFPRFKKGDDASIICGEVIYPL